MNGCGGCLGKLIGLTLGLLFVIILPASVWWFNMGRTGFQAETYIRPFAQQDVYGRLIPLILPALAEEVSHESIGEGELEFGAIIENLEQDDWDSIAAEIIPAGYLQEQTEENLRIYFAYTNGERTRLDIEFDTAVVRDNLLGQSGDRMINRIFSSWPECNEVEEAQIRQFLNDAAVEFPYCQPTDGTLQREVFTLLNTSKDELADDIPDTWNLREQMAEDENLSLDEVDRNLYETIQRPAIVAQEHIPIAFLMPAALLAMIVIFAVNSGKTFFRWMGWPLTLAGLATLIPLGFLLLIFSGDWSAGGSDNVDAVLAETLRGMAHALLREFTGPILLQGMLILLVGFLLLFISIVLPNPDDEIQPFIPIPSPPPSPTPPPIRSTGGSPKSKPQKQAKKATSSYSVPITYRDEETGAVQTTPPPSPTPPPIPDLPLVPLTPPPIPSTGDVEDNTLTE